MSLLFRVKQIGLLTGPAVFLLILLLPTPEGLSVAGQRMAAIAALMAIWWMTEALPIPVTSLLPVVLFPLLGIMDSAQATAPYANHLIFLFIGGFLIAIALEKWHLHRRIALQTLLFVGTRPRQLVLGMMLGTAFLSMGVSNTATTMVMIPIALSTVRHLLPPGVELEELQRTSPQQAHLAIALMLAIPYAASIGGIATLIGTPPNALLAGVVEQLLQKDIGFVSWMGFGVPLSLTMLLLSWLLLTRVLFPVGKFELLDGKMMIKEALHRMGPPTRAEKLVAGVGISVALGWVLRSLLHPPFVHDATIAMLGALALFLLPVEARKMHFLLDWRDADRVPWGIVLLFGGGFSLAKGIQVTGLDRFLVSQLSAFAHWPGFLLLAATVLLTTFLTEVTSNTATASLLLPLMASLAEAVHLQPVVLMSATCVATSFAFMLPVATPPNAIAFGTGYLQMAHMVKAGFWLNLLGSLLILLFSYIWLPVLHLF